MATDIRRSDLPGTTAFPVGGRAAHAGGRFLGNCEPVLDEMIEDEVVRRMMARDGVKLDKLRQLLDEVRERLI